MNDPDKKFPSRRIVHLHKVLCGGCPHPRLLRSREKITKVRPRNVTILTSKMHHDARMRPSVRISGIILFHNCCESRKIRRVFVPGNTDKGLFFCQSRIDELPKQFTPVRRARRPQEVCNPPRGLLVALGDNKVNVRLERTCNLRKCFGRQMVIRVAQDREDMNRTFDLRRARGVQVRQGYGNDLCRNGYNDVPA